LLLVLLVVPVETASGATYLYGGVQSFGHVTGIAATLTPLTQPQVASGHVAAWVGVGGPGGGTGGIDDWLQAVVNGFEDGRMTVYIELRRGAYYYYRRVFTPLRLGLAHRFALRQTTPGRWRGLRDRQTVGRHRLDPQRWPGQETTESWKVRGGSCNRFRYRLTTIRVLHDERWRALASLLRFSDAGVAVKAHAGAYDVKDAC
jgi:hypothetical protein